MNNDILTAFISGGCAIIGNIVGALITIYPLKRDLKEDTKKRDDNTLYNYDLNENRIQYIEKKKINLIQGILILNFC